VPMRKYQLLEVSVEAAQLTADNVHAVASWCNGVQKEEIDPFDHSKRFVALNLMTKDGPRRAQQGDYIVKNTIGEFSVMKPHEFEGKYAQVS